MTAAVLPFSIPVLFPLEPGPLEQSILLPQLIFVTLDPVDPESAAGFAVKATFDCAIIVTEDIAISHGGGPFTVDRLVRTLGIAADDTIAYVTVAHEVAILLDRRMFVVDRMVGVAGAVLGVTATVLSLTAIELAGDLTTILGRRELAVDGVVSASWVVDDGAVVCVVTVCEVFDVVGWENSTWSAKLLGYEELWHSHTRRVTAILEDFGEAVWVKAPLKLIT
jgi:hypothetical protein